MTNASSGHAEGLKRLIDHVDQFTVQDFARTISTLMIIDEEKIDPETAIVVCKHVMNDIGRYRDEEEKRRLRND